MMQAAVWPVIGRALCPTLVVSAFVGSAQAQQYVTVTTIFEHEIYVTNQAGVDTLMIDGREALSDGRVAILEIGLAGDTPYVLGTTGSGGNMCGSVPFVVSFATEAPAVDVSPLECHQLEHEVGEGEIRFSSRGDAITPSRTWAWTPEGGFEEVEVAAQDAGSGWDAFRTRTISVPADLLQYGDLVEALRALAGDDFELLTQIIYGPPDGAYEGTTFIGSNCISHSCPSGGTLVIADLPSRTIYLAWMSPLDEDVQVRPAVEAWPAGYAEELEAWQAQW